MINIGPLESRSRGEERARALLSPRPQGRDRARGGRQGAPGRSQEGRCACVCVSVCVFGCPRNALTLRATTWMWLCTSTTTPTSVSCWAGARPNAGCTASPSGVVASGCPPMLRSHTLHRGGRRLSCMHRRQAPEHPAASIHQNTLPRRHSLVLPKSPQSSKVSPKSLSGQPSPPLWFCVWSCGLRGPSVCVRASRESRTGAGCMPRTASPRDVRSSRSRGTGALAGAHEILPDLRSSCQPEPTSYLPTRGRGSLC